MTKMRAARLGLGWSQVRLSDITGIDVATLSRIENRRTYAYPGWLRRIGAALGVSGEDLLAEVGDGASVR